MRVTFSKDFKFVGGPIDPPNRTAGAVLLLFQDPALLFVKALRWLFSQGLDRERSRNSIITFNFKQEAAFFPTPMFRGGSINLLTPGKRQSLYLAPRRRTGKK